MFSYERDIIRYITIVYNINKIHIDKQEQSLSNLDSDSLRVEPLGHDRKNSAYWYFYGTRLYREDYIDTSNSASHKQKGKPRDKKRKRRRNRVAKEEQEEEEKEETSLIDGESKGRESVWQVVCFTQQDWSRLVEKFRDSVTITCAARKQCCNVSSVSTCISNCSI